MSENTVQVLWPFKCTRLDHDSVRYTPLIDNKTVSESLNDACSYSRKVLQQR